MEIAFEARSGHADAISFHRARKHHGTCPIRLFPSHVGTRNTGEGEGPIVRRDAPLAIVEVLGEASVDLQGKGLHASDTREEGVARRDLALELRTFALEKSAQSLATATTRSIPLLLTRTPSGAKPRWMATGHRTPPRRRLTVRSVWTSSGLMSGAIKSNRQGAKSAKVGKEEFEPPRRKSAKVGRRDSLKGHVLRGRRSFAPLFASKIPQPASIGRGRESPDSNLRTLAALAPWRFNLLRSDPRTHLWMSW